MSFMKEEQIKPRAELLRNKLTVVAGGSSKIGRTVAERLAASGAKIIIADINLINAEIVVQRITGKYKIESAAIPLASGNANTTLSSIKENWGAVDVWINIQDLTLDHLAVAQCSNSLRPLLDKNIKALFDTCTEVAAHLIASESPGFIINIVLVSEGVFDQGGLEKCFSVYNRRLMKQIRGTGIKALTIAPGIRPKNNESICPELILPQNASSDDIARLVHSYITSP